MSNLNNLITYNGAIPAEGPTAIGALIETNENQTTLIDLSHLISTGKLSGVQTVFVDLNNYAGDVTIKSLGTDQLLTIKAGTQGYYPILATNLLKFNITAPIAGKFNIYFINFPIALGVWGLAGGGGGSELNIKNNIGDGFNLSLIENDNVTIKQLIAGDNIQLSPDDDGNILITGQAGGGGGVNIVSSDEAPYPLMKFFEDTNTAVIYALDVSDDLRLRDFGGTSYRIELADPIFKPTKFNALNDISLNSLGGFIDFRTAVVGQGSADFATLNEDGIYLNNTGIYNVEFLINVDMTPAPSGIFELDIYYTWQDLKFLQKVQATVESNGNCRFQFTAESYDSDAQYNTIKLQIYSPYEINNCMLTANIIKLAEAPQAPILG